MAKAAAAALLVAALLGCFVSASLADQGTATYYTVYTRASLALAARRPYHHIMNIYIYIYFCMHMHGVHSF
jgi:hypothetical protein